MVVASAGRGLVPGSSVIGRRGGRHGKFVSQLVVCAVITGLSPLLVHAQEQEPQSVRTVRISGDTAPETIRLTPAVRIGDTGPGAGPLGRIAVSADSSVYAVGHIYLTTEVNLYGKSGLHLRTIGREGSGPGEFRNLITLATLGDSLFVYDNSLLRETVFDFRGNLLRDRRVLPRIFRAVPTASGQLAMNAQDVSPGRVGAPLHVVDGTGSHVRSFPNAGGRYRADEAQLFRRALARSMDARFWSAYPTKYEVEQWDLSGTLTARVERVVDWFRPHQQRQVYRPGVEPLPRVWDIHEDRDGRLWVLLHVVDDRWPSTLRPTPNPELSFNGNLDLYWDSVVEVLDPIRGVLIGRTRSDTYFAGFTTAGQLMSYHEPDQGEPFITVWNVSIR